MNELDSKLDALLRDGLSSHTGEFLNPWLIKGNWSHEQLAQVLEAVLSSNRLRRNLKALLVSELEALKDDDTRSQTFNGDKLREVDYIEVSAIDARIHQIKNGGQE